MKEKTALGLLIGLGTYLIGQITMVTIVFFVFILIDLVSGVIGSKASDEPFNRKKLELGVYKKMGYILFWIMGVMVQLVLLEQGKSIGIDVDIPIVSLTVTFWLLGTEGLSILNNLYKMGVKGIPKWFVNYFERMQAKKIDSEK